MPCKSYKDTLIETATSGSEPQGDLRSHLADCADCRAAFEQERSLFAFIDDRLHIAANAEVPASLLPRVRARLDEESAPRRIWTANWFVLASAAVLVVAFFAARIVRHQNVGQSPVTTSRQSNSSVPGIVSSPSPVSPSFPPQRKGSAAPFQAASVRNTVPPERLAVRDALPEVLVTHDQEVLLVRYAEQWRRRKRTPLVAEASELESLLPLQVAPIQIAQLDVKLLAEEQAQ